MPIYHFFDTDDSGFAEYDIAGGAYRALLNACFKYAHTVALYMSPDYPKDLSTILPYRIPVTEAVQKQYSVYALVDAQNPTIHRSYTLMHFKLTPELKAYISKQTDHIWGWTYYWGNYNPDDICFFRADESVFFSSKIHEGMCAIYPKENEDISEILTDSRWILQPE